MHDTKILDDDPNVTVTIRSPSGDTDIIILMNGLLHQYGEQVILDDFHRNNNRKLYRLSDIENGEWYLWVADGVSYIYR